jgi:hypothetical protein
MPKLSSETVTLLDGDIRVFKRARSRAWQATFKMDGRWVRVSTKCKQLAEAKEAARELYIEYKNNNTYYHNPRVGGSSPSSATINILNI